MAPESPRLRNAQLGGGRLTELAREASCDTSDATGMLVAIDPVTLRILPQAMSLRGLPTLLAFGLFFASLPPIAIVKDAMVDRRLDATTGITLAAIVVVLWTFGALSCIVDLLRGAGRPILFDRRLQRVCTMKGLRGTRFCEAAWSDLVPCLETGVGIAGPFHRLRLVRRLVGSDRVSTMFLVGSVGDSTDRASQTFEFIRRFMEDGLRDLPPTAVRSSLRSSLEEQLRGGFFVGGISRAASPWVRTSYVGRALWAFAFLPVLWLVAYPLEFAALIGSRLGPIPRFPDAVERDARYEPDRDGVLEPEIAARFPTQSPVAPGEFRADVIAFSIASIVWFAFAAYVIFIFINDPPHGFK